MRSLRPAAPRPRVTVERIEREIGRSHFAVLSTSGSDGTPGSAGVSYGTAIAGSDLTIYVMTRRHLRKARDIAGNPAVSLVIPLRRSLFWFLPPATIQLRGQADLLDWTDAAGVAVFERFWLGRRILEAYRSSYDRGERRICFVKITPDPLVRTYMVGSRVWELRGRMESGGATVALRPE